MATYVIISIFCVRITIAHILAYRSYFVNTYLRQATRLATRKALERCVKQLRNKINTYETKTTTPLREWLSSFYTVLSIF